jgi:hypothetical protein
LAEPSFQPDLAEALPHGGATAEQLVLQQGKYFQRMDSDLAVNPDLAAWRHQLSLVYLWRQIETLDFRADEATGVYTVENAAKLGMLGTSSTLPTCPSSSKLPFKNYTCARCSGR